MAINETRNISHLVFPAFLEEIPLQEAIEHLLEGMNPGRKFGVKFEYDSPFLTELITPDVKLKTAPQKGCVVKVEIPITNDKIA